MTKNGTAKPKLVTVAVTTAEKSIGDAKTARTRIQAARKMEAGVIGYATGSRFSDEEVRGAIRRALSRS